MLCHHENALQNADERCHDCANVDAFGSIVGKSHGLLLVALVPGRNKWCVSFGFRAPTSPAGESKPAIAAAEEPVTFNHGVEGSSPSALTNKCQFYKDNLKLKSVILVVSQPEMGISQQLVSNAKKMAAD
jgi:hypothetical protein